MDTILKGLGFTTGTVGERMKALAKDPPLPVRRRRQGPRRRSWPSSRSASTWIRAQLPRAFNTLVNPNMEVKRLPPEEEPGAPTAYGGAGSIDGKIPGTLLDQPQDDRPAQQVQPGRPDVPRVDSRPHPAGRVHAPDAAHPAAAGVQRLLGRLGALRPAARRRARRLRERSGRARRATCRRSPSAPAGWSSTPAFTPSAGRASRACSSSSRSTARIRWRWRAKSIAIARGPDRRAATRSGTARSTASARRRRRRSGRSIDLKAFDDAVVLGGNVPLDVLAKNVDEYVRSAKT